MVDYRMFNKITASDSNKLLFLDILDREISMPNIPMKVMDCEIWWETLARCNGWKLQQNTFTRHARIIEESTSRRIAWGTINGMIRAIERYKELSDL